MLSFNLITSTLSWGCASLSSMLWLSFYHICISFSTICCVDGLLLFWKSTVCIYFTTSYYHSSTMLLIHYCTSSIFFWHFKFSHYACWALHHGCLLPISKYLSWKLLQLQFFQLSLGFTYKMFGTAWLLLFIYQGFYFHQFLLVVLAFTTVGIVFAACTALWLTYLSMAPFFLVLRFAASYFTYVHVLDRDIHFGCNHGGF